MGISLFAQNRVQKTFNQYAQTPISSGMRAESVAQALLDRARSSVQITSVQGSLTDHFDPKKSNRRAVAAGLRQQLHRGYRGCGARDRSCDAVRGALRPHTAP
jgi:Zn-dependent membrane protease YugP